MWYITKSGDSLSKLAGTYLGNIMDYMKIFDQNRSKLSNPDLLPIGIELWIPKGGEINPELVIYKKEPGILPKGPLNTNLLLAGLGVVLLGTAVVMARK